MKKIITLMMFTLLNIQFVQAAAPQCNELGEQYVSWPTKNPIWEMCYLDVRDSSATQGSSLEVRKLHYNGILVMERMHMPMLFAQYTSGLCYRDWKDTASDFLRASAIENPVRAAITTCDASVDETEPVGSCPFADVSPGGSGSVGNAADCFSGVQVEKYPDHMVLTTNHSASWYKYTARYIFHADGRIQPRFGFGNSTGTQNNNTHWHHGYWRMNFDIDGPGNDEVFISDDQSDHLQAVEFADWRELLGQNNDPNVFTDEITWMVKDSVTGRGYRVVAGGEGVSQNGGIDDYAVPADPSGVMHHEVDVMVTKYKLINGTLTEYSDTPGSNSINNCNMQEENLVGNVSDPNNLPESLVGEDVVFWYRTAVNDIAPKGMLCKTGGPTLYPVGNWGSVDIPPTAVVDAYQVEENSMDNVLNVMSNDTDPDGGSNVIESVTQPNNGSVVISNDTQLLYTPDLDYCNDELPTDDFTYTLNGGSEGQVSVAVSCFDDDLIFKTGFELAPPL